MPEHGTSGHGFEVCAGGAIYAQKSVRDAKHEVGEWDMRAERGILRKWRREQKLISRFPREPQKLPPASPAPTDVWTARIRREVVFAACVERTDYDSGAVTPLTPHPGIEPNVLS